MEKFTIIIPTYRAAPELDICLESLARNSTLDNEIRVYVDPFNGTQPNEDVMKVVSKHKVISSVNGTRLGPYGSWNLGAKEAENDILCFITDDQYFAPDWDGQIAQHMSGYPLLTGQLVESGISRPYQTNLMRNFGRFAGEFDEKGFLDFVQANSEDRVAYGGFYIPTVMNKELFNKLGKWPNKRPFPYPNDWLFRQQLHKRGMEYHRVLSSFSYHFQGSSAEEPKPLELYFERREAPRPPPTRLNILVNKAKAGPRWSLVKAGILKPLQTKVSGYSWPKAADVSKIYKYCTGRGVEIGAGSNRVANINTISVDLTGYFKGRVFPDPDIISNAYDLSGLKTDSKDFIINAHVMEHLINPIKALNEWKRVIKPGGHFYLIVPDKNVIPHRQDNEAEETTLVQLIQRHEDGLTETVDSNPDTSCLGNPEDATFSPTGDPGMRHFNYWTSGSVVELLEYVGLETVEVLEAPDKDTGMDSRRWHYDDFTVIAKVPEHSVASHDS
jgi:glycosyltransferase involved in cell wall biosynthesis